MTRFEIIVNQSIEEDIMLFLEECGFGDDFTYLNHVYGRGRHGRREGSAVWPEENVIFIIYSEDEQAELIAEGLKKIKAEFQNEGFRCYISSENERVI